MSSSLSLGPPPRLCLHVSVRRPLFPLSSLSSGVAFPKSPLLDTPLFHLPSARKPCLLTVSLYLLCLPGVALAQVGTYLWKNGDAEGLVADLTHQVEGDDWEDVPGGGACLPAHQLLPEPEAVGELLRLSGPGGQPGGNSPSPPRLSHPQSTLTGPSIGFPRNIQTGERSVETQELEEESGGETKALYPGTG